MDPNDGAATTTTESTATRPLAVVTGASSGIGLELTRLLIADGHDVIGVAEQADIHTVAKKESTDGARVVAVQADLSTSDGVEKTFAALRRDRRPIAVAALNAGVGRGGRLVDVDLDETLRLIDLNVRGTVHLATLVLREMNGSGSGRVLITSSVASTMPGPYQAVYNASKSFVQSFAEGIALEFEDTDVTVTSLMPGPTDTDFFRRAQMDDTIMGNAAKDSPAAVARQGYDAMMAGRTKVVAASLLSKAMATMDAVTPDVVKAAAHRVMARPRALFAERR